MLGYMYRHYIIIDDKEISYIGQTIQKPHLRWGKDGCGYTKLSKKTKKITKFGEAIIKYGWNNFKHEIIGVVEADNEEELIFSLNEWEKYYIEKYDSYYNGFNSTIGGSSLIGEHNPMYGTTYEKAPKARAVVCITTGQKFDTLKQGAEWCGVWQDSISKCCRGVIKFTGKHPTTGEKLRWCYYEDYVNDNYDKITEEDFKKQRYAKASASLKKTLEDDEKRKVKSNLVKGSKNPMARKVVCVNYPHMIFESLKDAAKWCGLYDSTLISKNCNNKVKSAGKHPETGERLTWMYYEEYLKTIK